MVYSTIHCPVVNRYPMDNSTNFDSTYPLVSDLTIHPFKNWGQIGKNPLEIVSNCFDFLC